MITRLVPTAPFVLAAFALAIPLHAQDSVPESGTESAPTEELAESAQNLTLIQATALRCSAGFAIISRHQDDGQALEYPLLRKRGREFFVQVAAKIMDDTGIGRDGIAAVMAREASGFKDKDDLKAAMPACLMLLDASGL